LDLKFLPKPLSNSGYPCRETTR